MRAVKAATAASPPLSHQNPTRQRARDQRDDDVKDDRQDQRLPWHRYVGDPEKESDNRRKGDNHDQIVHRNLHQCAIRIALGQLRLHEHYRGARSSPQQDQPGHDGSRA